MPRLKRSKTIENWTNEILTSDSDIGDVETLFEVAATSLAQENPLNKINKQLSSTQAMLIEALKVKEISSNIKNEEDISKFSTQVKILELAIDKRQKLHKERTYFLEQKVAEAGIFAVQKNNRKKNDTGKIVRKIRKGTLRYTVGEELTPFDAKVLMSLHKLWENKGKTKELTVNMYEILRACHLTPSGDSYNLLENSLLRLFRAEVVLQDIGDNTEERTFIHLLQEVGFERGRAEQGKDAKFTVMFTDRIYNSMAAGYFERFSGALLADLSSGTAQILMIALQPEFRKSIYEWTLDEVCLMIDLTSGRPSTRRTSIQKALSELETYKHISNYRIWDDYSGLTKVWATPGSILLEEDIVIKDKWEQYSGEIKDWWLKNKSTIDS
ncbi:replication initiator protein A [Sulfoacidibacillus ferrooxidans]|uniref:Uncharacterized protein n=1 Tax=Sulfoacidibacillus ferrooxidans TaxID=2005001 RepID=A0A9X1VBI5_9BACL|nr:replication initiator protein A [Sulfoacidibacillus ferrooxidans]MCI0184250.1 hypothetical protein [Sulfoacidibacillus ferrooxidans]